MNTRKVQSSWLERSLGHVAHPGSVSADLPLRGWATKGIRLHIYGPLCGKWVELGVLANLVQASYSLGNTAVSVAVQQLHRNNARRAPATCTHRLVALG